MRAGLGLLGRWDQQSSHPNTDGMGALHPKVDDLVPGRLKRCDVPHHRVGALVLERHDPLVEVMGVGLVRERRVGRGAAIGHAVPGHASIEHVHQARKATAKSVKG